VSFLESLFYGLISGLSELLPVSSLGHQALMLRLFGLDNREPARDVFVHIGILLALISACRVMFNHAMTKQRVTVTSRRGRRVEYRSSYDLRLVKAAVVPFLLGCIAYFFVRSVEKNLATLSLLFIANGILVIVPEYTRRGNKDGRFMSGWDSVVLGLFGALSAIPGISRGAAMNFYTSLRGADRGHALNWFFLLSVPAIFLLIFIDIINLFVLPLGSITFLGFLGYLASGITAFIGGHLSVSLMRYLSVHMGYTGFAYYSWGVAMFSFVLYLIV
jgi:undecaprenyl-diphosphatase